MGEGGLLGPFLLGVSLRNQSSRIYSSMLPAIDAVARNGYPVSGSQVVLLVVSFSDGDKNCRN